MLTYPTEEMDLPIVSVAISPNGEGESLEEEETLVEENEDGAMDLGTDYKEESEQDMDDLIHSTPGKSPNQIPPLEDM